LKTGKQKRRISVWRKAAFEQANGLGLAQEVGFSYFRCSGGVRKDRQTCSAFARLSVGLV
jgi:hypothetical protein